MTPTLKELMILSARQFQMDPAVLTPETDFFEKLSINSFQALELLSAIEKQFRVEIPDYELQGVTTFKALADIIDTHR